MILNDFFSSGFFLPVFPVDIVVVLYALLFEFIILLYLTKSFLLLALSFNFVGLGSSTLSFSLFSSDFVSISKDWSNKF